ncbi:MAG: glycosyltransferase family 4 protein [Bacteroidia bacterium]
MRIGFDSKRFFHNQTGLGNYSREVIYSLCEINSANDYLLFDSKGNDEIDHKCGELINPTFFNPFWRNIGMGRSLVKNNIDIFHGLSNQLPFDLPSNIPAVCTVHDVIFRQFPEQYKPFDRYIYHKKSSNALQRSDIIIVPSEYTKKSILDFYSIDSSKLKVVYQSINPEFFKHQWEPNWEQPYIVYHSSFNNRKNHDKLIKAFANLKDKILKLVLIGEGSEKKKIFETIETLGLSDRVEIYGHLNLNELIIKLKKSVGFVYPSVFEGFGIPLTEVATMGIPIIASDIEVFREIMGEEISYFDPGNIDNISELMTSLLDRSISCPSKSSTILKEVTREAHARKLLEIYDSLRIL